MKLLDLNPRWIDSGGEGVTDSLTGDPILLRERIGMIMDCPCGCKHSLYVPFRNPVDGLGPIQERPNWERTGNDFETLTLTPSIQRIVPNCWHGFITNGEIITC